MFYHPWVSLQLHLQPGTLITRWLQNKISNTVSLSSKWSYDNTSLVSSIYTSGADLFTTQYDLEEPLPGECIFTPGLALNTGKEEKGTCLSHKRKWLNINLHSWIKDFENRLHNSYIFSNLFFVTYFFTNINFMIIS